MRLSDLNSTEYLPYYQTYLNHLPDQELISLLKELRDQFVEFLEKLSPTDLSLSYADGKWSVAQVLQHIVDTERIFQYRALSIARKDKTALPGFDQEMYVSVSSANSRMLPDFINEFAIVRNSGIALFESMDEEMLKEIGNANGAPLSPRAAGFISAGHQKHHLILFKKLYLL
jgi:arsenate reductase-like glutaredoxin family protein